MLVELAATDHLSRAAGMREGDDRFAVAEEEADLAEGASAAAHHDRPVDGHGHQRRLGVAHAGGDGQVDPGIRLVAPRAGQDAEHDTFAVAFPVSAGGRRHAAP